MRPTLINLLSKRITIPQLSPSHTSARILRFLPKANSYVETYDPIMILECSEDLVSDPADRDYPDQKLIMIVETCDEGLVRNLNTHNGEWINIGTEVGIVDDDDPIDDNWTWQAYKHKEDTDIN